jgi:hypothetical protein
MLTLNLIYAVDDRPSKGLSVRFRSKFGKKRRTKRPKAQNLEEILEESE